MARTQPKGMDVERFLIGAGMIGLTPSVREKYLDLDTAAEAAYEDFQADTGIKPFMAETNATTRYYPVNGNYVKIHPYFTITAVHEKTDPYETVSEAQTLITDYIQLPDQEAPIRALEFDHYIYRGSSKIGVTGRRGWTDDMPARVFQALCGRAAGVHLRPQIASAINNGAISWQEGDVSEKYGAQGAFSAAAEGWAMAYAQIIDFEPRGYRQLQIAGA